LFVKGLGEHIPAAEIEHLHPKMLINQPGHHDKGGCWTSEVSAFKRLCQSPSGTFRTQMITGIAVQRKRARASLQVSLSTAFIVTRSRI
jgi:hypothetical protein